MQLKCIQCGHVFNASSADQCPSCHKPWYRPYPCTNDTINDDVLSTILLTMPTLDSPSYDFSFDSSSSCNSSSD